MDVLAIAAALAALDVSRLDLLVRELRAISALLRDIVSGVGAVSGAGWSGAGQGSFAAAQARVIVLFNAKARDFELASLALGALSTSLHSAGAQVRQAKRLLANEAPADVLAPIRSQLELAVQTAADADRRAAAILREALAGPALVRTSGVLAVALAGQAAALVSDVTRGSLEPKQPAAVSIWWSGLTVAAQARFVSAADVAGGSPDGLDGLPGSVRDARNRRRLASALKDAEHGVARRIRPLSLELSGLAGLLPWPFSLVRRFLDSDLDKARQRLSALQHLTRDLTRPGSELLTFDARGDGRAVVASGDPDSSGRVAVLVPGMSTELEDVPRLIYESDALAEAAGSGSVVVAWLGYDAPSLVQVASDAKAKAGARELRRFTEGLRAAAGVRQRLTVIGHSYGTLVAGIAARTAALADNLVLLASPGVEAASASELEVPAGHVWAGRDATDPIQLVFWPDEIAHFFGLGSPLVFGPDPMSAAFGARHLGVAGAYGHSGYFAAGSASLNNLGRIISGS